MFKFNIGESVRVQVLNIVTNGEVISRKYNETKYGIDRSYSVKFNLGGGYEDTVSPDEQFLIEVQKLPLGIMK